MKCFHQTHCPFQKGFLIESMYVKIVHKSLVTVRDVWSYRSVIFIAKPSQVVSLKWTTGIFFKVVMVLKQNHELSIVLTGLLWKFYIYFKIGYKNSYRQVRLIQCSINGVLIIFAIWSSFSMLFHFKLIEEYVGIFEDIWFCFLSCNSNYHINFRFK